jgi:hypothetical protein
MALQSTDNITSRCARNSMQTLRNKKVFSNYISFSSIDIVVQKLARFQQHEKRKTIGHQLLVMSGMALTRVVTFGLPRVLPFCA